MKFPEWPTHPDGTPKTMGELPEEEQIAWAVWAGRQVARELEGKDHDN